MSTLYLHVPAVNLLPVVPPHHGHTSAQQLAHSRIAGPCHCSDVVVVLQLICSHLSICSYHTVATVADIHKSLFPAHNADRPVFVRERNDGLYHVLTYLLAKLVQELLIALLASVVVAL